MTDTVVLSTKTLPHSNFPNVEIKHPKKEIFFTNLQPIFFSAVVETGSNLVEIMIYFCDFSQYF